MICPQRNVCILKQKKKHRSTILVLEKEKKKAQFVKYLKGKFLFLINRDKIYRCNTLREVFGEVNITVKSYKRDFLLDMTKTKKIKNFNIS